MLFKQANPQSSSLHHATRLLFDDQSSRVAYGLAALLAVLFMLQLYPLSFLGGSGLFFEQKDAPQHVSGWLFYLRDSWHFPLLHTERLNHPEGVNIAFTDSIPLAALFFKPIGALLPPQFHYFGLWHGVVLITQALAATFLIRALGLRHLPATLAAVGFALTWPALLWRFEHTALMTHALILVGLGLYFLGRSGQWRSQSVRTGFIALMVVGLLIHPYFLAFCATLFLVYLADQAVGGEGWTAQILPLVSSIVVLALVGVLFGYFGNSTQAAGFGNYSMNLTAPFCGGHFFSCVSETSTQPFKAFHFFDATQGQYEGYNYLGLGLLLLIPFALYSSRTTLATLPRRYPVLLAALVLLTVYAVSNKVFFNGQPVLSYTVPAFMERLTGTFRASGRFFWIVGYAILFATLAAILKKPTTRNLALLAFALALQWADGQPLRKHNTDTTSLPGTQDVQKWAEAVANVDRIALFPAFGCREGDPGLYLFFQRVAAHYGKLLDTGYIARQDVNCAKNALAFDADFPPRQLSILSRADLKTPLLVPGGFQHAIQRGECIARQEVVMCQSGANLGTWQKTGLSELAAVSTEFGKQVWTAAMLPTQAGVVAGERIVPKPGAAAAFLSFGPYVMLHPGRYRMRLRYASDAVETQQVGRWDVVANRPKDSVLDLDGGKLIGTRGAVREIESVFRSADAKALFEIRTFFTATGDLQVLDISLERAP